MTNADCEGRKVSKIITETAERLHPARDLALGCVAGPQLAPVADLHVMGGFHDVGDVVARVHLQPMRDELQTVGMASLKAQLVLVIALDKKF